MTTACGHRPESLGTVDSDRALVQRGLARHADTEPLAGARPHAAGSADVDRPIVAVDSQSDHRVVTVEADTSHRSLRVRRARAGELELFWAEENDALAEALRGCGEGNTAEGCGGGALDVVHRLDSAPRRGPTAKLSLIRPSHGGNRSAFSPPGRRSDRQLHIA